MTQIHSVNTRYDNTDSQFIRNMFCKMSDKFWQNTSRDLAEFTDIAEEAEQHLFFYNHNCNYDYLFHNYLYIL